MGIECELPPLRSLDDFLLGSARFQMPNLQDLDKWGNRVTKNFLYYQTNYFVMVLLYDYCYFILLENPPSEHGHLFMFILQAAILSTLFVLHNPMQTIAGLCAVITIIVAVVVINPNEIQGQPKHEKFGTLHLGGVVATIVLFLYLFQSIMYVTLVVLLPFCAAFVHASFRLRNLRNKLSNVIDERLRYTPMGVFLEAMNVVVDAATK